MQADSETDKKYECSCPHHKGPNRTYVSQQDLVRHQDLVQKTAVLGPITFLTPHLLETPEMALYGLAVNLWYKVVLCLTCAVAVIPMQLKSHLQQKHSEKVSLTNLSSLLQLIDLCDIDASTLPDLKEPLTEKIDGLPIIKLHSCSSCAMVASTYESLKSHVRQRHRGMSYPSKTSIVTAQPLFQGPNKRFVCISVNDKTSSFSSSKTDILSHAQSMLDNAGSTPALMDLEKKMADPRNICPWLRNVRWQDLVSGSSIADVIAMVKFPTQDEYPSLSDGLLHLLCSASPLFNLTSELILQDMNSPKAEQR